MARAPQVLVVSSLRPQCGRTAVALRLAAAWAETRRTAFLDADPSRGAAALGHSAAPRLQWMDSGDPPDDIEAIVVDAAAGPPEPLPHDAVRWLVLCPADAAEDLDAFLASSADGKEFRVAAGVLVAGPGQAAEAVRAALALRLRHGSRAALQPLPFDAGLETWKGPFANACRALAAELADEPRPAPRGRPFVGQRADRPLTAPAPRSRDATPAWQVWAVAAVFAAALAAFRWRTEISAWAERNFPAAAAPLGVSPSATGLALFAGAG